MSARILRMSQTVIDVLMLALAFALAFVIRFDGLPPESMFGRLIFTGPYVIGFQYAVLLAFGVHRFSWRYVGLGDVGRILVACGAASVGLVLGRAITGNLADDSRFARAAVVPYGVIAIDAFLVVLLVVGVRVVRRVQAERGESVSRRPQARALAVPTLLVGAGQAGVLVARELARRPDLNVRPVGFVDDDPRKAGTIIHGIPVVGRTAELPHLCETHGARQALITMANVPGDAIRRIRRLCEEAGIPAKIIPGIYEIVRGSVNLSRIRDIAIEDLLRREPVELDLEALAKFVSGKTVMVTGAGGSIGSELCRQLARFHPRTLALVERGENPLFHIHRELVAAHADVHIEPYIADVTDAQRMQTVVHAVRPAIILHAAAHKHVPIMELCPGEAIKNNVFGTKTIADLAASAGVEAFVMISTDKAVNPSSVMGASKRAAELYVQSLAARAPRTRFVTVRFGNVLGSEGSVVPVFRQQIAQGGPITITHPDMRRYFMTIPEACQLVLQAGAMGRGGEIFILDMGEPVRIVDLAHDLISLSGLRPGDDIQIEFTGTRPGEKLFEELATDAEHADKTHHPKIFVGRLSPMGLDDVERHLSDLASCLDPGEPTAVKLALGRMIPEYHSTQSVPPPPLQTAQVGPSSEVLPLSEPVAH